jgi:hypothetical protein
MVFGRHQELLFSFLPLYARYIYLDAEIMGHTKRNVTNARHFGTVNNITDVVFMRAGHNFGEKEILVLLQ